MCVLSYGTQRAKITEKVHKPPQNHYIEWPVFSDIGQRYTYRVLQTIQMKLILLWVWAERAVLGRAKTPLKFKYEIQIG